MPKNINQLKDRHALVRVNSYFSKKKHMRFILVTVITFWIYNLSAQSPLQKLKDVATKAEKIIKPSTLSKEDIAIGLKEALIVGTKNSVGKASKQGGFNNNKLIKIPFPKDAVKMKSNLVKIGMRSQVDKFEYTLSEAAEEASKYAQDIFLNVIKKMNIKDAVSILNGDVNAATKYLENQTRKDLYLKFKPIVTSSIQQVNLMKYWGVLAESYNAIPLTKEIDTDLEKYVTNQAIDGLFFLIAQEEEKIRKNPKARVSEILEKVFK